MNNPNSASAAPPPPTRVRCYLDGFNFYHGICEEYDIKWIDLEKLFQAMLSQHKDGNYCIEKIYVFSAKVDVMGDDKDKRQQIYFNALEHHSNCDIEIEYGFFKPEIKKGNVMRNNDESHTPTKTKKVIKTMVEKQTDVNLACHMVDDAHTWDRYPDDRTFDVACLISNDGDLARPLEIMKRMMKNIILITPIAEAGKKSESIYPHLKPHISKEEVIPYISRAMVVDSQLPESVNGVSLPKSKGWPIAEA